MRSSIFLCCTLLLLAACGSDQAEQATSNIPPPRLPNIIYILADDLGYGDLSCYGQQKFQTPNIDQLAKDGMRFTQHYAGSTVCAPSRSALMSGQHTGHTFIRGNKEVQPEGQYPLADSIYTLAEMLQDRGYVTGAFGKWGLGFPASEGDPNRQGFDEFYGYNCQRLAHNYYPYHLWSNQDKILIPENAGDDPTLYAPFRIQERTLDFIERYRDSTFFLYVPHVIPHAELLAPEAYMEKHRGRYEPERSYQGVDSGENFRKGPYGSQAEAHAAFAAMVNILDDQVGAIRKKLQDLGLEKNTLIIFTSDNGPHLEGGADPDYFDSNGPLRGYKRDLYEGGIRVPMIAMWPGRITPSSQSDHISAFWDVWPTFAELSGAAIPDQLDGLSFLPTLLGEPGQQSHGYLYWEFHEQGGRQAIRRGDWKAVRNQVLTQVDPPIELYNLKTDVGETNDVADQHPEIVKEMQQIMQQARFPSAAFPFFESVSDSQ